MQIIEELRGDQFHIQGSRIVAIQSRNILTYDLNNNQQCKYQSMGKVYQVEILPHFINLLIIAYTSFLCCNLYLYQIRGQSIRLIYVFQIQSNFISAVMKNGKVMINQDDDDFQKQIQKFYINQGQKYRLLSIGTNDDQPFKRDYEIKQIQNLSVNRSLEEINFNGNQIQIQQIFESGVVRINIIHEDKTLLCQQYYQSNKITYYQFEDLLILITDLKIQILKISL